MKLLLVDDDAFLRDMYATKFNQKGHTVEVAESGVAGLRALEKDNTFEIILLDMVMPGMNGIDFIKKVKDTYPDSNMKFIVLSNQGQREDIEAAESIGVAGYIVKAESIPSEVVSKVEELYQS
ncbi:response regulator [Candidatus Kaiserbacteria bacterium]|nr:response regulator [Candidatus Kaiserbacteria bacterium]